MAADDGLAVWLRAQIADDQRAIAEGDGPCYWGDDHACDDYGLGLRTRILAECDAKEAIVKRYETAAVAAGAADGTVLGGAARLNLRAFGECLRAIALPYAKRPGYRAEWAP